jgi:DNA (cytosine-5)-methyltransferase 1
MTVVGLFAGIGGLERAMAAAGFEASTMVEIDPVAREVLKSHFPNATIESDVKDLVDLPSGATVVTAGFPCQNLSMAGDKSGIRGAKSGVVEKMFDLIERSEATTVVVENVYFMLQLDNGAGMRWLAEQFERLRFRWAYRVLDTGGFGLPHRRRRVYLVAMRDGDPRQVLFADGSPPQRDLPLTLDRPLGFYWTEGRSGIGLTADGIPPLKVGSAWGIPSPPAVLFPDGEVLTPSLAACEALQGFPVGWVKTAAESQRGAAWRLLGNAVSVPVAAWVAGRIRSPGEIQVFEGVRLTDADKWPDAACNIGNGRHAVAASDKPLRVGCPGLDTFRDESWSRLSERALSGFLGRVVAGGLRTPTGFIEAVQAAPRKQRRDHKESEVASGNLPSDK